MSYQTTKHSTVTADDTSIVSVTPHGEKYHISSCQYITEANKIKTTLEKAIAEGYTRCSVCKP